MDDKSEYRPGVPDEDAYVAAWWGELKGDCGPSIFQWEGSSEGLESLE